MVPGEGLVAALCKIAIGVVAVAALLDYVGGEAVIDRLGRTLIPR